MQNFTVSEAKLDDLSELVELLGLLFTGEHEFSAHAERQATALRLILTQPEVGRILVLRSKDRVEGMVSLLFTVSTFMGGRAGVVEDFIIRPEHRSGGWGKLLFNTLLEWAEDWGCLRLTVLTDSDNTRALAFYEKRGFVRSSMVPLRWFPSRG